MKKLGFEFKEIMSGTYTRVGQPERSGELKLQARAVAPSVWKHLRDRRVTLDGTLDMEDFADDVPVAGTIEIRPVFKKIIRYDFSFVANDGCAYRFVGQKDIRFQNLIGTMTTLNGTIQNARGEEVARSTLHFNMKADFLPFLVSLKHVLA